MQGNTTTDPTVALIRGTGEPEQLVCEAARNDYRSDGITDASFGELMQSVEPDADVEVQHTAHTVDTESRMRTLLRRLMHDGHWGPFEHPSATLSLEGVTRVAMAQITRHRHFTFDIMSLRYVNVEDDDPADRFEIPPEIQGDEAVTREGVAEIEDGAAYMMQSAYADAVTHYRRLLDAGVPQEEARKVLPMGTKVNIVMTGNARAWMHLLNIRGKANVQGEARRLADQIHDELSDWMPYTFEHYDEELLPLELNP